MSWLLLGALLGALGEGTKGIDPACIAYAFSRIVRGKIHHRGM